MGRGTAEEEGKVGKGKRVRGAERGKREREGKKIEFYSWVQKCGGELPRDT